MAMDLMDLSPASTGRMVIALGVLGVLAVSVWLTMEPGKYRDLTWVLLGFFGFRVVLGRMRAGRPGLADKPGSR